MKTIPERKCRHCSQFFQPDPRHHARQRYCVAPECRHASKAASQARWLACPANRDYFRGPENVQRVQAWRTAHPGYGKRFKREQELLQEMMPLQEMIKRRDLAVKRAADRASLQEMWRAQSPLVVGLIAHLAGTTSPADTMSMMRRLITHGQELLINKPTHSGIPPAGTSAEKTDKSRRGNPAIGCRPNRSVVSA